MMREPAALLAAGAIVHDPVPGADRVDAMAFAHPAVPNRTVVRLVSGALAPGVVAEADILGFAHTARTEGVGYQRQRSLGFPGWALVNDPERARFALDVMRQFKVHKKRISTKPGNAKEGFQAIADDLGGKVPHFLPTFWEEVGRAFSEGGNPAMAATAFDKARGAESQHGLDTDPARIAEVYLEFSLAGALTVKSLQRYAKELQAVHGAKAGYERFFELCVGRTLGGVSVWSTAQRDLRGAAKAAGLDADHEDDRFLRAVIGSSGFARASFELLSGYEASIRRVAVDPSLRARLLDIHPKFGAAADRAAWLGLLDGAGCFEAFEQPRGALPEPSGGVSGWMGRALAATPPVVAVLLSLVCRFAPRLRSDGVTVNVLGGGWAIPCFDVVDLLIELGVPCGGEPMHALVVFDLRAGLGAEPRDPVFAAAHPVVGPVLERTVLRVLHESWFQAYAAEKTAYRRLRGDWLGRQLDRLGGSVQALDGAITAVKAVVTPAFWAEFPEALARWRGADLSVALRQSLVGGTFAELQWSALEDILGDSTRPLAVYALHPYAVVTGGRCAYVFDVRAPETCLLTHDLRIPAGAHLRGFAYAQNQLFVAFIAAGQGFRSYWSGIPGDTGADVPWAIAQPRFVAVLPDGRTFEGGRAYAPGDTLEIFGAIPWDSAGIWRFDPKKQSFAAVDGANAAPPPFLAGRMHVEYHPASDASPLGALGGQYGFRVQLGSGAAEIPGDGAHTFQVQTLTGESVSSKSPIRAFVSLPGGDRPRLAFDTTHAPEPPLGSSGWRSIVPFLGEGPLATTMRLLPTSVWHALRPRDPASSQALRAVSEHQARALFEGARALRAAGAEGTAWTALVSRHLAIADPVILAEVAALCQLAAARDEQRLGLVFDGAPAARRFRFDVTEAEVRPALSALIPGWYGQGDLPTALEGYAAALAGLDGEFTPSRYGVLDWVGRLGGLLFLALSPAAPAAARSAALRLVEQLAASPLCTEAARVRHLRLQFAGDSPIASLRTAHAAAWLSEAWGKTLAGHRYVCKAVVQYGTTFQVDALEWSPDGTFVLPPGVVVEAVRIPSTQPGPDWLRRAVALGRERGAIAHDPAIYDAIAARTGLTRTEAVLLWAGMPGVDAYEADFLGKERRDLLDLKQADAKAARPTMKGIPAVRRLELYAAAIPEDPADLWRPLEAVVPRLCDAWNRMFGQRAPVPESLLARAHTDLAVQDGPAWLVNLASVGSSPKFNQDLQWKMEARGPAAEGEGFEAGALRGATALIPWVNANTPVGDPLRANLLVLRQRLEERLANPDLILPLGVAYGESASTRAFLASVAVSEGETQTEIDGVVIVSAPHCLGIGLRPRQLAEARDVLARLPERHDLPLPTMVACLRLITSRGYADIFERITSSPVPAGRWEQDPRLSAPAVVAAARSTLHLDEAAATLYLQMLALHDPTRRDVLAWNGWKTADYAKAEADLVAAGLVVSGKRARAGRDLFLPGGWIERNKGSLPMERWKLPLYDAESGVFPLETILPLCPIYQLFERAWDRVTRGDAPRYEEPG